MKVKPKKLICLFSGLGADYRAFQFLNFPSDYELFHVVWPESRSHESIVDFTKRLSNSIPLAEEMVFIGVSFGGIIAQEMTRYFKGVKVIILSSVQNNGAIPRSFKLPGMRVFSRLLPNRFLKSANPGMYKVFGIKTAAEKKLLAEIMADSDPAFVRWAMLRIPNWKPSVKVEVVHIHGSADRVFPLNKHLVPSHIIEGGGHFMVANRAQEISVILKELI